MQLAGLGEHLRGHPNGRACARRPPLFLQAYRWTAGIFPRSRNRRLSGRLWRFQGSHIWSALPQLPSRQIASRTGWLLCVIGVVMAVFPFVNVNWLTAT